MMGSEWQWEGDAKPDGLVILRNQNQTLLSIQCQQLSLSVLSSVFTITVFHFCSKM